jgi:hypothetical protein
LNVVNPAQSSGAASIDSSSSGIATRPDARDHDLRIAAVRVDAGELLVEAVREGAAPALRADAAVTSEEADADTLADLPRGDPGADGVDAADDLVPRHAGEVDREHRLDGGGIRVADAAGLDPHSHLAGARLAERQLGQDELAGLDCLNGAVGLAGGHVECSLSFAG